MIHGVAVKIWLRVLVLVLPLAGLSTWHALSASATAAGGGGFVAVGPSRVLDTRIGVGAAGPVGANSTVHVQIAGRGGVPASGVSAVVLNVTETDAQLGGYVTVYPDGTSRPVASNLNFPAGDTRANLVTVRLGASGGVAMTNSGGGTVQLVADVAGYYLSGTPTSAGTFVAVGPSRVLDTRIGVGAAGPVGANSTVHLQIAGRGGVPAVGVSAVVLNVTETDAQLGGYLTVYPDGTSRPVASNLNFPAGDTRANLVTVRLGAGGGIAITNSGEGTVQVVADVAGYYLSGTPTSAGAFVALAPTRVLDTRTGAGAVGPVGANSTVHVQIAGRGGVPASGVSAVVLNVTETDAQLGGYVTVYPDGTSRPVASNLNFPAGDTRANLVTVRLGASGGVAMTNSGGGTVQLVADVAGYYLSGTPTSATPSPTSPASAPTPPPPSATSPSPSITSTPALCRTSAVWSNLAACGWPGPGNTGYPHGQVFAKTLTGGLTITRDGTVIDGYKISGGVVVAAKNVVIRNSWITNSAGGVSGTGVVNIHPGASATIDHNLLDGLNATHTCIWHEGTSMVATANDCTEVNDGIFSWATTMGVDGSGDNFTIADNWLHNFTTLAANGHVDGYQTEGAKNGVIRHNTFDIAQDQTSAIAIWDGRKNSSNIAVADNLIQGGGFSVYVEDYSPSESNPAGGYTVTNVTLTDNRFSNSRYACVGNWGVWFTRGAPSDGWHRSGNLLLETGQNLDNSNPIVNGWECR